MNFFHQYFVNILMSLVNLVSSFWIIRALSIEDFGAYSSALAVLVVAGYLGNFGLGSIILNTFPTLSKEEQSRYFGTFISVRVLVFSISIVAAASLQSSKVSIVLLLVLGLLQGTNQLLAGGVFQANLMQKFSAPILLSGAIFRLFVLYWFSLDQLTLTEALWALLSYEVLVLLLSVLRSPIGIRLHLNFSHFYSLWPQIVVFTKSKFLEVLCIPAFGVTLLSMYFEKTLVAQYSFIVSYGLLLVTTFSPAAKLEALIVSLAKKEVVVEIEIRQFIQCVATLNCLVILAIISILWYFEGFIVGSLLDGKFEEIYQFLPITMLSLLIGSLSYHYSPEIYLDQKIVLFPQSSIVFAIVNLASLAAFFVSGLEVFAFFSLALGNLAKFSFLHFKMRHRLNLLALFGQAIGFVALLVGLFFLSGLEPSFSGLLVGIAITAVAMFVFFSAFILLASDKAMLRRILRV